MKTTLLFALLLCSFSLISQSCAPDGVTFSSAQDIIDFTSQNPDCSTIEGDVTINGISSFAGLEQITTIQGEIICNECSGFQNFEGLNNLQTLGGIDWAGGDEFDFDGLESLNSVLGDLHFFQADFTNFFGLDSLNNIEGDLTVEECTLYGFSYIPLESVGGSFVLKNNSAFFNTQLISLNFVGGDFIIQNNPILNFANGFSTLEEIEGDLKLIDNPQIIGFLGEWGLTSVEGDVFIEQMPELDNLDFLENLQSIEGAISLLDNESLQDINGIANIDPEGISALQIAICSELSECSVSSVCGFLQISPQFSQLGSNLTGCNTNEEILSSCGVSSIEEQFKPSFSILSSLVESELIILSELASEFIIHDAQGRQVLNVTNASSSIDVSALSSGLYFIRQKNKTEGALRFEKL